MRILLLMFLLAPWAPLHAENYAIVVSSNSHIGDMNAAKIRDIFLKKRNFQKDVHLFPVNLIGDKPARILFEKNVLGMSRVEIKRYWVSNHFQGVSPPTTQASLEAIKKFIENVEGAIGYLPVSMIDENLNVVYEF
jgi:hypothetical protein